MCNRTDISNAETIPSNWVMNNSKSVQTEDINKDQSDNIFYIDVRDNINDLDDVISAVSVENDTDLSFVEAQETVSISDTVFEFVKKRESCCDETHEVSNTT